MSNKPIKNVGNQAFILPDATTEQQLPEAYTPLYNAKGTNALATIPTSPVRTGYKFKYITATDKYSLFTADDVEITVDNLAHPLYGRPIQFYYYLLTKFTKKTPHTSKGIDFTRPEAREIPLDTTEYLKIRGKEITPSNRKNAAKEITSYVNILLNMFIKFDEKEPKSSQNKSYCLRLLSGLTKKGRTYSILLSPDVLSYLFDKHYITNFPNAAFQIDVMRHPSAFSLAYILSVFYSENRGKDNQGIVSLGALLKYLSDIPQPDEIRDDRHLTRRIIDPLEENLRHLEEIEILDSWEWANAKREPLTEAQFNKIIDKGAYEVLAECFLNYKMKYYPEGKPALEAPKETKMADLKHPERCKPNPQKAEAQK